MEEQIDIGRYQRIADATPLFLKLLVTVITIGMWGLVLFALVVNVDHFVDSGMTDKSFLKRFLLSLVAAVVPLGLTLVCRDLWMLKEIVKGAKNPWSL